MSEGHGCDSGQHHCGGANLGPVNGGGDGGCELGTDGRTPIPNLKRVTINGAPVIEASHEYVVGGTGEPGKA